MRISSQDQILFAKRLSILLKAEVPILEALQMLKQQARTKTNRLLLATLASDVSNGQSIALSLRKFKNLFGELAINIIGVGEISGNLGDNLNYLAEELKKHRAMKKKVISAMVYPLFIVAATLIITLLLTIYVFPKILPVLSGFNFNLPWATKFLIFLSALLIRRGLIILLALTAITGVVSLLFRLPKFKLGFDRLILDIPIIGKIFQNYHLSNFCRTLGLLLKSDIKIVQAVTIAGRASSNLAYQKQLTELAAHLAKGGNISNLMEKNPKLFPAMLSQMIAVGETAGSLSNSLLFLGEVYDNEVSEMTQNLSTLIEPALMIFMGILVGFVAISIITPIYELTQSLHP